MHIRKETWIGLMVIVGLGIALWGYKFLQGKNILTNSQVFYVEYDYVDMLENGDPVLLNGYQVGSVTNVALNPKDYRSLIVELDIQQGVKIHENTVAYIYNESIMGEKAIQLEMPGLCSGDQCASSGDYLEGDVKGMIRSMFDENEMDQFFSRLENNIKGLVDSLGGTGEDTVNVRKSLNDFQIILDNLATFSKDLNNFMGQSSTEMTGTLRNLRSISQNIEQNNDEIQTTLENTAEISEQIKNAGLDTAVTEIRKSIHSLDKTLNKLDETIDPLKVTLDRIEQGEGTLGKLTKDDDLYRDLQHSVKNLDYLLQDIRLNPKRYIHISVFGKKQKDYTPPENDPAFNNDSLQERD